MSTVPAGEFSVDVLHSEVAFEVEHNELQRYRASFTNYSAQLQSADEGGLAIEGAVVADSVDIPEGKLRDVVLGEEFFDAANHPEITFRSSDVSADADGSLSVSGTLTLKGKVGEVTGKGTFAGPVTDMGGNPRVSVQVEASIDRNAYGLEWHANLVGGENVLGDEVKLIVNLELSAG